MGGVPERSSRGLNPGLLVFVCGLSRHDSLGCLAGVDPGNAGRMEFQNVLNHAAGKRVGDCSCPLRLSGRVPRTTDTVADFYIWMLDGNCIPSIGGREADLMDRARGVSNNETSSTGWLSV